MEDSDRTRVDATAHAERIHDSSSRFRTLTAGLCVLLAAVALLALLVAASNWPADGPSSLALLSIPLAIVVLLVLAWGLMSEAVWSVPLAILLLWGLVLFGSIDVVVGFAHGEIQIPIGAIVALLILTQRPRGGPRPVLRGRDRWIAASLIGAYATATLWPYAVWYFGGLAS